METSFSNPNRNLLDAVRNRLKRIFESRQARQEWFGESRRRWKTNHFTSTDFQYEKNGNIKRGLATSNQLRTFVFNADNKQTEVKDANGATVGQYYYDGEGKRVKKYIQSTGETTIFVYSSGKLIAEYSTVVAPASVAKVAYTTTDHLGSPRVITDALGQVSSRRDFMPFGEDLNVGVGNRTGDTGLKYSMPGDNVRQKFTGYQKDNETQRDFAELVLIFCFRYATIIQCCV